MATGTKIIYTFIDDDGKTVQVSHNNAKSNATKAQVLAAANAMIAQTALFQKTLVSIKSIVAQTTSENVYDLTETRGIPEAMTRNIDVYGGVSDDTNEDTYTQTIPLYQGKNLSTELAKIRRANGYEV